MNYREYAASVRDVPVSEKLKYQLAVVWLHPQKLPLALVSLGGEDMQIIRVPAQAENSLFRSAEIQM